MFQEIDYRSRRFELCNLVVITLSIPEIIEKIAALYSAEHYLLS